MKIRILLLFLACLCLVLLPAPVCAQPVAHNCIILLQNDSGLLTRQADKLHMLIDLLPDDYQLGLALTGWDLLLVPEPLTLARRAELHALLQAAVGAPGQSTERDMQQLTFRAIRAFSSAALQASNLLILALPTGETSADWNEQSAVLSSSGSSVIVLTEQQSGPLHPLVKQASGQQLLLDGSLLNSLVQQMGLGNARLAQAAIAQGSSQSTFHLDQEVESFAMMVEHVPPTSISLVSPNGQVVPCEQEATLLRCLVTPNYTCLHIDRVQAAEKFGWDGDWQLSVPAQAEVGLWLVDPVRIDGEVQVTGAGRVITASVWRAGERLDMQALGRAEVVLRDSSRLELMSLNDIGLNGDEKAADGTFSGTLPDFVHPLAGITQLEVQGYVYRSTQLYLPTALPSLAAARRNNESLLLATLGILIGTVGLSAVVRPLPVHWQLQHRTGAGYLRVARCGARALYAGSGKGCALRLSAATGKRHLRLKTDRDANLSLEVLQSSPITMVNGAQVFLSSKLQHGDVVQVGSDQVLIEQLSALRIGRRRH